jgi:hypothetical protein
LLQKGKTCQQHAKIFIFTKVFAKKSVSSKPKTNAHSKLEIFAVLAKLIIISAKMCTGTNKS